MSETVQVVDVPNRKFDLDRKKVSTPARGIKLSAPLRSKKKSKSKKTFVKLI